MIYQASAPGRCGIVGNPSDIYGGTVVSCSVPARAVCRLAAGSPGPLPSDTRLLDAAFARAPIEGDWHVEWSTTVPRSSGLSGSTALLGATLACFLAARGEASLVDDPVAMGEFIRDVERHDAQVMCGYQDAQMIAHGGLRRMDFPGKHPVKPGPPPQVRSIPWDGPLPFLLVTTGVERLSGSVHGPMADRWMAGERLVVDAIDRITELGRMGAEALEARDWEGLAEAMNENHRLIAGCGGSGGPIDELTAACLEEGALAAKLAGAGMGGTVIALAQDPDSLQTRLGRRGWTRFMRPEAAPGLRLETAG